MAQYIGIEGPPLFKMPFSPPLSESWKTLNDQLRRARVYTQASLGKIITVMGLYVLTGQCVQELLNQSQAYSISERIELLQRVRRTFYGVQGTLNHIHEVTAYGPGNQNITCLRNQCDMIFGSIRDRISKEIEGQQESSVDSNGMPSRSSPVTYGDDAWMHDMSVGINQMLSMEAFGPFTVEYEPATLGKDRRAPAGESVSNRHEMPTSSARHCGEAASRLPENTIRQAAPNGNTTKKSRSSTSQSASNVSQVQKDVAMPKPTHSLQQGGLPDLANPSTNTSGKWNITKPTHGRPVGLPAVGTGLQQGLPTAEQAAVPMQTQKDHPLQLGRSSPKPLPLPADMNKLPKFKRKKKRADPETWTQTGEVREQNLATNSEALRRQEASPQTSQPRQRVSTIPLTPLPATRVAPKPPKTPGTTPPWRQHVTNAGRKRSASSSSERNSGAGPSEWYKRQRTGTVSPKALDNGTKKRYAASRSDNLTSAGRGLKVPASLPPKPPVSMPTSQDLSAATQAVHGTGPRQHTSPVKRPHTKPFISSLGSAGYSVAPHQQGTQPREVSVPFNSANVPSTESPYDSGAQYTTSGPPQRNYVRYRQPALAPPLQGLSLPRPGNASGPASPQAMGAGSGNRLAGQASLDSHTYPVYGPHTSGAAPRSLPAASDTSLLGLYPTSH